MGLIIGYKIVTHKDSSNTAAKGLPFLPKDGNSTANYRPTITYYNKFGAADC